MMRVSMILSVLALFGMAAWWALRPDPAPPDPESPADPEEPPRVWDLRGAHPLGHDWSAHPYDNGQHVSLLGYFPHMREGDIVLFPDTAEGTPRYVVTKVTGGGGYKGAALTYAPENTTN
jgi:hypothetical protein